MAITGYTGLPGSGKSYSVVEHVILPCFRAGVPVFTNIPMNTELLDQEFGGLYNKFEIKDVIENPDWFQQHFMPGATLVLDEAWRLWPAGLRANQMLEQHKQFLAEHRHMVGDNGRSTEIAIVTQDLGQISSYPRSLIETTYRTTKLVIVGANNRFRVDIYEGAVTGPKPPKSQIVRQIPGKYVENVYKYYKSQTLSQAAGHGDETRTDTRTNILKSKWLLVGFPLLAVLCGWLIWVGLTGLADMYGSPDDLESVVLDAGPQVQTGAGNPEPAKPKFQHFYNGMDAWISFNMGTKPSNTRYLLTFQKGENAVTLDQIGLLRLGYTLQPIDQCMVILDGHGSTRTVTCQGEEKRSAVEFNL